MVKTVAFTLLEMLVVLLLIIIFALLAIPSLRDSWLIHHRNQAMNRLLHGLQYARLEAIHRHEIVTVCPSVNQQICGGDWRDGQLIIAANSKQLLQVLPPFPADVTLNWRSSLGKNDYLQFAATGFTTGQQGSFYYCSNQMHLPGQAIIINYNGRIRLAKTDSDGKTISCN